MILAASLIGPENFLEYSTKEDMFPKVICPKRYIIAPKILIRVSDKLFIKLTEGPTIEP